MLGKSQWSRHVRLTLRSRFLLHDVHMTLPQRSPFYRRALVCWNWKCALLSATVRSLVYLVAMTRTGMRGGPAVVLVEMMYVTLTAGVYAGLQQRALDFRSRVVGNLTVVLAVPGLAQVLDWLAHWVSGAVAPARATVAVCIFTGISALFHLHVMRRGAFLSGHGRTLRDDFRRMPRLIFGFVSLPFILLAALIDRTARPRESQAAL